MTRAEFVPLVRRLHFLAGLMMSPFVVLYGVTAFLYNHPASFADRQMRYFGRAEIAGTAAQSLPSADDVARRVVAALGGEYRLRDDRPPRYSREYIFATIKGDDDFHNLLLYVDGAGGTIRTRPVQAIATAPFDKPRGFHVDAPLAEHAKQAIPTILQRTGASPGEVTITSVPDVNFVMDGDGKTWRVTYSPMTGSLTGTPDGGEEAPSIRQFFTRLHGSHGYPPHRDARWWWAVLVDVMAGAMVFWVASGLFLWWQIRGSRLAGLAALLVSAVVVGVLCFAMWGAIRHFG